MNKAAKSFLKQCFECWYSDQVIKQLEGKDLESTELEPISLDLAVLKELMAQWLVDMADYFAINPMIIVNGFVKAGITGALDGDIEKDEEDEEEEDDTEDDFDVSSNEESDTENDVEESSENETDVIILSDED